MRKWVNQLTIGILIGLFFSGLILFVSSKPGGVPITIATPTQSPDIYVHIDGAVEIPGVYKLPRNSRGTDAISTAGGLLENADTSSLNLASQLADNSKLYVPYKSQNSKYVPRSSSPDLSTKLNINTATVNELDELPDIGESKAHFIVDYRNTNGFFQTIEDILNVPGIGPAIFDKIKFLITVE